MKLAQKITLAMLSLLFIMGMSVGLFGFRMAYRQVDESAGIELVGCANITTGLVDPAEIEALSSGNAADRDKVENTIDWITSHKPIFKEAFIIAMDGTILAADSKLQKRGYEAGSHFYLNAADAQMLRTMKHPLYSQVYTYDGARLKTGYAPIFQENDPTKDIVGLMAVNFDASIIQERTLEMIVKPYALGAAMLLATAVVIYFMVSRMVRPLTILTRRVELVAAGDMTLGPLSFTKRDEIGRLARSFDQMTQNLKNIITEVRETSRHVSASAQQLSASATQTGEAGEHTVLVTTELAEGADMQLHILGRGSALVQDMSLFIRNISMNAEQALLSASGNLKKARDGCIAMENTANQMGLVNEAFAELAQTIQQLTSHSHEIKNVLDIISDIAKETHLLALNAAIEAARAGEEGRGFAIVADSVRKLAGRSASSVERIEGMILRTLDMMETAGTSMEQTALQIVQGSELISSAGTSFSEIEHSASLIAEQSEYISASVHKLSESSAQLVSSIQTIVDVANQNNDSAQTMSAASQQQLAAMEEVDSSAHFLSTLSEKLQHLIEKFKL
ncbi:HAMP domain-containing protein [Paenibacillus sp. HJL G12]|uniref:HAMP domain-containing protein n=1 Tax=Paenibacillus dendrobii TaxID=2691084 RepID=A0A7X3IM26_9BACL|nr:methyl-accepting chemotaxis protein [Paenibacillus dendrobii]MWV46454.1 HAMP domain-containing protein [Paenibacillus dendrobii]